MADRRRPDVEPDMESDSGKRGGRGQADETSSLQAPTVHRG
jgi:hypothetical protein